MCCHSTSSKRLDRLAIICEHHLFRSYVLHSFKAYHKCLHFQQEVPFIAQKILKQNNDLVGKFIKKKMMLLFQP